MKFNVDFILTLFIFALLNHPTKSFIKLHASFEIKNLIGPLPIDIKNSIQPNIIPNLSAISYNLPILKNQKVKKLKLNIRKPIFRKCAKKVMRKKICRASENISFDAPDIMFRAVSKNSK